jgi:hypothetical protein
MVHANVTSKRGRDFKLFKCKCYIEDRQRYQNVCVNVTYRTDIYIKLFVRMLHRKQAELSKCLCRAPVNVTYRRDADISIFL